MRVVTLLAVLPLLVASPPAHAKRTIDSAVWTQASGEFAEDGATLTVAIVNRNLALRDGTHELCAPTPARAKQTKKGLVISARWRGCEGLRGKVRLAVTFTADAFDALRARLRARALHRRFHATRPRGNPSDCADADTFDVIQRRVFGPSGCRVTTCHGAIGEGGLDLQAGRAYDELVGVAAENTAAAAAGKLRVISGNSAASFLVQKLTGTLAAGEGDPMPPGRKGPTALEIDLVRAWIDAGAPRTGKVPDAPCPPRRHFEPAEALSPPVGGYQLVLDGPTLQPGEEIEGCMWVQAPNDQDFAVGAWEFSLNPGTHHFAVWEHEAPTPPEVNVFRAGDIACITTGARFGITLSGAPEAPYFVDAYAPGIGKIVKAGTYLGLNPHYYNEFDEPITVKVWINLLPVEGPLQHVADSMISLTANLNGTTPFSIFVPPNQQVALKTRFANTTGAPMSIFELSSHTHKRGIRFRAWHSDGRLFYENNDWAHPALSLFDPPLVLAPNDFIDYECVQDNGVTRPVRHCGDAPHDTGCTPGSEIPITFGTSAEDEMCLLTGLYY